jgi:hypothetical protein
MRSQLWWIAVLGLALTSRTWAEESAQRRPAPAIEDLIDQLGDRLFRVREAAGKALENLGPAALPALRKGQAHADPEVRRRLDSLIPTLEKMAALQPRRVSLRLAHRPLREVLAEIARQTGYKVNLLEGGDQEKQLHTFLFDRLTFWEALDQVCEKGNVTLQSVDNEEALTLAHQGNFAPFVYRTGPFRFAAQSFQYSRTIDFSQVPLQLTEPGQRTETLDFTFNVMTEPKLPLLGVGTVKMLAAYDDRKFCMLPDVINAEGIETRIAMTPGMWNGAKSFMSQAQVSLIRPSRKSKMAKILKGVMPLTLLMDQKAQLVSDQILAAKGKKVKTGTTSWNIEDVAKAPDINNKAYRLKLTVTQNNSKDATPDNAWANSLPQRLELQDAKGRKYQMQGIEWQNASPTSAQLTLIFGDFANTGVGSPAKLIYYNWVTLQHEVTFEFKNLPLP